MSPDPQISNVPAASGFVPARPEDTAASGFVPARPEDTAASGFVAARPEDTAATTTQPQPPQVEWSGAGGGPVMGLPSSVWAPMASGFMKEAESGAGDVVEGAVRGLTGPDVKDQPGTYTTLPTPVVGSFPVPETARRVIQSTGEPVADWLKKNTNLEGFWEHGGAGFELISELMRGQGEGKAAMTVGEGAAEMGRVAKALEGNSVLSRLARLGLKMVSHASRTGPEMYAQTLTHTNDPDQAMRAGAIGTAVGAVFGPLGEKAVQYVQDMRSGSIAQSSGLIKSILGIPDEVAIPRPTAPVRPPYPLRTEPPPEITTERPASPEAPTYVQPPNKPNMPPPPVPTERPAMPIRPLPLPSAEPTPVPQPPTEPEPYTPQRAPAVERLAQQEKQLARETVAEKFAREAQTRAGDIGDPDVAAGHLENLNKEIEDEGFVNLPADQQAQLLEARAELLRRAQPAADPRSASEMLDNVNDMGDAVTALRHRATEAYNDWNAKTEGQFTSANNVFAKTRGKFDADSITKRNEAEAELMNLWRKYKVAAPIDRAVYRAQFADSYVMEDGDKAFTNSFKGADRTGDLDPKALQRNWKSYVNKYGSERIKSVYGEERYNGMNQFVNDMAGEDEADKAVNSQIRANYAKQQQAHRAIVQNAKTLDEAKQAAIDAKNQSALTEYQTAKQQAQIGVQNARIQDRLNRSRQITDFQKQHQEWQDQVLQANNLNAAKRAAYNADREQARQQNRAITQAQNKRIATIRENAQNDAEARRQIDEMHQQAREQYQDDLEDYRAAKASSTRRSYIMALGRGLVGSKRVALLRAIATSPTAQKVIAHSAAVGANPEIIAPLIQSILNHPQQRQEKPQ